MVNSSEQSILIADDNPNNLRVLSSMLEEQGYRVRVSQNGEQVMKSVELMKPDLILLDVHMPVLDGYDTCRQLKANDEYKEIPVIFVSAMSEAFNKMMAFDVGGIDYIVKPFQLEEVNARVKTQLELKQAKDLLMLHENLYQKYKDFIDAAQKIKFEDVKYALEEIRMSKDSLLKSGNLSEDQLTDVKKVGESVQKLIAVFNFSSELDNIKNVIT